MSKKDDKRSGKLAGYTAAELAAKRAGEEWKRRAYEMFFMTAKSRPYFSTEDVRLATADDLPEPPDRRAWGYVARTAMREQIIELFRIEASTSRICHGRLINIWQSLIYKKPK